ncbi:MAG: hypothetical protein CMJ31_08360 [Phycisphaerae bacterium]|nr:hypothetical protein [Phycisphaerae bacterium]
MFVRMGSDWVSVYDSGTEPTSGERWIRPLEIRGRIDSGPALLFGVVYLGVIAFVWVAPSVFIAAVVGHHFPSNTTMHKRAAPISKPHILPTS